MCFQLAVRGRGITFQRVPDMATLWKRSGKLLKKSGNLIDCTVCPCLGTVSCSVCVDSNALEEYEVSIAGFANDGCGNCTDLNDTFVLAHKGAGVGCDYFVADTGCCWSYAGNIADCGDFTIELGLFTIGSTRYAKLLIFPKCTEDSTYLHQNKTWAEAIDCGKDGDLDGLVFGAGSWLGHLCWEGAPDVDCDHSGMSATLAVP